MHLASPSPWSWSWPLARDTAKRWIADRAPSLAASLAFYATLSLAPLLIVAVAVAGFVFGDAAARGELTRQLDAFVGPEGASAAQAILAHAGHRSTNVIGATVGVVVLFFGASGVFAELQESLNQIWSVKTKEGQSLVTYVRRRLVSFVIVLLVGFLLLVSLIASALLSAVGSAFERRLPGGSMLWSAANFGISLAVIAVLFALVFKLVPDTKIAWRDVGVGAALTAILFAVGKWLIGFYLGRASIASAYGAAGSLVVLIVWVYYSSQILFFGAELTRTWAEQHGSRAPTSRAHARARGVRGRGGARSATSPGDAVARDGPLARR